VGAEPRTKVALGCIWAVQTGRMSLGVRGTVSLEHPAHMTVPWRVDNPERAVDQSLIDSVAVVGVGRMRSGLLRGEHMIVPG
jgi:hypothetical protein